MSLGRINAITLVVTYLHYTNDHCKAVTKHSLEVAFRLMFSYYYAGRIWQGCVDLAPLSRAICGFTE